MKEGWREKRGGEAEEAGGSERLLSGWLFVRFSRRGDYYCREARDVILSLRFPTCLQIAQNCRPLIIAAACPYAASQWQIRPDGDGFAWSICLRGRRHVRRLGGCGVRAAKERRWNKVEMIHTAQKLVGPPSRFITSTTLGEEISRPVYHA